MKYLTRAEELILLAIVRLKDDAYCVPIYDLVQEISEKEWTLGSIYNPLYRLEKNGFVKSFLGAPSAERGGKSKRYYKVTKVGIKALQDIKKLNEQSWDDISEALV